MILDIDDRSVPETFRDMVFADLRRAARLIVNVQDEIDPQFRIATPEGDYWLAVTLPREASERIATLKRVSLFMTWKQCFIFVSELTVPDCVYALGASHREVHVCYSLIKRAPRPWSAQNFGPIAWVDRKQIGQEMIDLCRADRAASIEKSWRCSISGSGRAESFRRCTSRAASCVSSERLA